MNLKERKKVSEAMSIIGKIKTDKKSESSRKNGAFGGRPKKQESTPENNLK